MERTVYHDWTDEGLAENRRYHRGILKQIEQEIARRREEKYGFPHWWCSICHVSYRNESGMCPQCDMPGEAFTQSMLEEANG